MPDGSPVWQGALLMGAALFLLFELWRGWRAGFARAGINFAAIVLSGLAALFAAHLVAEPFGGFTDLAGFIAALIAGGGLGLFTFFVLWLTGIIFFKRTDHQGSGFFRLLWGTGGAFFGVATGILFLWGGISIIRSIGALAEAKVQTTANNNATRPAGSPPHAIPPPAAAEPPPALAQHLVKLKNSLELGPAGKLVESVDLMPTDFYELILQIGTLTGDQDAMMRFMHYPGVKEVMTGSQMAKLINDPEIIKAAEERDFLALIGNKTLHKAVEDPELAAQLKKIDFRAAMKFALEKPQPPSAQPNMPVPPSAPAN